MLTMLTVKVNPLHIGLTLTKTATGKQTKWKIDLKEVRK
jgi:hypothetical protein